jgi:integrase
VPIRRGGRSRPVATVRSHLDGAAAVAGRVLAKDAYLFSNDPSHAVPWNPDWISHVVSELAKAAGVDFKVTKMRHYTASQLLAGGFDPQNTAPWVSIAMADTARPFPQT